MLDLSEGEGEQLREIKKEGKKWQDHKMRRIIV